MPSFWERLLRRFRRSCAAVLILFACVQTAHINAQVNLGGHVSLSKKLSVIKTEYFDFIFAEESAASARHLALCADGLYRKAAGLLHIREMRRFPVLLTRETAVFNAYFTTLPYNRIVLYDSAPPSSFAVFSDNLASVFYHELVHALTLNIRSPFWKGMAAVFGDAFTPSFMLNLPSSFTEGAAVSFESADGQGRLNDAFSLHVVRQAKLENKFPDWPDVTGAYGAYTDGSLPYMFGASFSSYIQQRFGMDKYAEFWEESGKVHFFKLSAGIFKKVYGLSLTQAWNDFKNSYPVPHCEENLPPALCSPSSSEYRAGLRGEHLYANLTSSPGGLAWYDAASSSVMFLPIERSESRRESAATEADGAPLFAEKPVVLCTSDLSERLTFSRSGDFLTLSGVSGGAKAKRKARVYDMKKKRFVLELNGLSGVFTAERSDSAGIPATRIVATRIVAGIEREGLSYSLVLYDFDELTGAGSSAPSKSPSSHSCAPFKRIRFPHGVFPFDAVDAGNGRIMCILKHASFSGEPKRLSCSLFSYDMKTDKALVYEFADESLGEESAFFNPSLRYLSAYGESLYLSCAQDSFSQPALAFLDLNEFEAADFADENTSDANSTAESSAAGAPFLSMLNAQYSGGVFYPAAFDGGLAFVSRFYEHRTLSYTDFSGDCRHFALKAVPCERFFARFKDAADNERNESAEKAESAQSSFAVQPYRPLQYMKKPLIIPFAGFLTAASFGPYASSSAPLGLSAATADPAERFLLTAGAGYDIEARLVNANASASFSAPPIQIAARFYIESAVQSGMQNAAAFVKAGFERPLADDFSRIGAENTAYFLYSANGVPYIRKGMWFVNRLRLFVSRSRSTGPGPYERIGFTAGASLYARRGLDIPGFTPSTWLFSPVFEGRFTLPCLLPFKNPRGFTLNFPASCATFFFVNAAEQWEIQNTLILFAHDIQKGSPFVPIFSRRLCLEGGTETIRYRNGKTDFAVNFSLFSVSLFNTGAYATMPVETGISVRWEPFENTAQNWKVLLRLRVQ
ncbi:hypothetical protein [Treponema maltophilum]|uniref:hypothetical protein n=1 Tax=Treponema maltophilum TaxID=51160 RepID=UPI003D8ECBBF